MRCLQKRICGHFHREAKISRTQNCLYIWIGLFGEIKSADLYICLDKLAISNPAVERALGIILDGGMHQSI